MSVQKVSIENLVDSVAKFKSKVSAAREEAMELEKERLERESKWKAAERDQFVGNQEGSCSANSFLFGDKVCDDVTNTERCFWDQGDCCSQDKDEKYCLDCTCKMSGKYLAANS